MISMELKIHPRLNAGFKQMAQKIAPDFQVPRQVHGSEGFEVNVDQEYASIEADFLWTQKNFALGVFVADCTAILAYSNSRGLESIAAIHAGWRGTAKGVVEKGLAKLEGGEQKFAWMSPSICQNHFEVGSEVLEALGPDSYRFALKNKNQKYLLDLAGFQKRKIENLGFQVLRSPLCTYCQPDFFSYRKSQGNLEARQLAWIQLQSKG